MPNHDHDPLDNIPVESWVEAGQRLLDHARKLAGSNAGAKEMALAIGRDRHELPQTAEVYDSRRVPVPDRRVIGDIVVERPTTRQEAGDELSRRAVARFTAGEFTTIAAALRAAMADDPMLTKIYAADGLR